VSTALATVQKWWERLDAIDASHRQTYYKTYQPEKVEIFINLQKLLSKTKVGTFQKELTKRGYKVSTVTGWIRKHKREKERSQKEFKTHKERIKKLLAETPANNSEVGNKRLPVSSKETDDALLSFARLLSAEEAKVAYLAASKRLHPDRAKGDAEKMTELNSVWTIAKEYYEADKSL
jgi:hypothetical protein